MNSKTRLRLNSLAAFVLAIAVGFAVAPVDVLAGGVAADRVSRLRDASPDAVRIELDTYFSELESSSAALFAQPAARAMLEKSGLDPLRDVEAARRALPQLTDRDLDALRIAFVAQPAIFNAPEVMQATADRVAGSPAGRLGALAVNGNTCSPGSGTPLGITDVYIAAGVSLAAELVMEGFPTDGLTILARIAPIAAYGVAQTAVLVLDGLNAVEAECLDAQDGVAQENFRNTVSTFIGTETNITNDAELDAAVSTVTTNDDGNTQTILDALDANTLVITTAIDASATAIINNDNTNRNTIINNDNTNRDTIINNDNTNLATTIAELRKIGCDVIRLLNTPEGQRGSSLSSCSGQPAFPYNYPERGMSPTSIATPSLEIDLEPAKPVRRPFASTVSLEIHLLEGRMLPSYYLPVARGGMLEEVKALVWSTLDAQRDLGIAVGQLAAAESFARSADDLLTQNSFVDAFRSYAKAYQQLLPQ